MFAAYTDYYYDNSGKKWNVVVVVVVMLVFNCPSTLFRSFRARSVYLSTLFLGKSPRQFTSI